MGNPSLLQITAPGELPSMRTFKIFKKRRTEPSTAVRCLQCACICASNLGLRSHLWCHWWCLHHSRWTSMMMMMTWEGTCPNIFLLQALSTLHKILLVFENILSTRSHFYRAKYLWPWKAKWTETEKCLNGKNTQIMNKFSFRPYNESFIDQACSVKIAGHWPCDFFVFLLTLTLSQSMKTQKKNLANILAAIGLTLGHQQVCYRLKLNSG